MHARAAPAPPLATALTEDPAPPPEEVDAAARAFAADGDVGVQPPVLGIAVQAPGGAPLPSRDPNAAPDAHHEHHEHRPAGPPPGRERPSGHDGHPDHASSGEDDDHAHH